MVLFSLSISKIDHWILVDKLVESCTIGVYVASDVPETPRIVPPFGSTIDFATPRLVARDMVCINRTTQSYSCSWMEPMTLTCMVAQTAVFPCAIEGLAGWIKSGMQSSFPLRGCLLRSTIGDNDDLVIFVAWSKKAPTDDPQHQLANSTRIETA